MEPKIRERPILFSVPMVRAILADTKTQTRRVVKMQPRERADIGMHGAGMPFIRNPDPHGRIHCCPYGKPGDRLYVRETWRVGARWDDSKPSDIPPNSCTVLYRAGGFTTNGDAGERIHGGECSNPDWAGKTRTAIHMPRWASRIDLEITGVRVERLQDISRDDAIREGAELWADEFLCDTGKLEDPRVQFAALWESINGAGSWGANPWLWVVEFKRVDQRSKV